MINEENLNKLYEGIINGNELTTKELNSYGFNSKDLKELIEQGYLYIATPPLYLCKKGQVSQYCWNDQQLNTFIQKYADGNERQVNVQRYKGLGEMDDVQLYETTMNPETRTLRQVTIENAATADHVISMLMGDEVAPRRNFIEQNATYANIDA